MTNSNKERKVVCPYCGYSMPLIFDSNSNCYGVFLTCKGRNCKNSFELRIVNGVQKRG